MITCDKCNGKCCRYVSIKIKEPKADIDFEELKWFLVHKNVSVVYQDHEGEWIVEVATDCEHLTDNKCAIYKKRPQVCKDYELDECEANTEGEDTKVWLETPADVDDYRKSLKTKRKFF